NLFWVRFSSLLQTVFQLSLPLGVYSQRRHGAASTATTCYPVAAFPEREIAMGRPEPCVLFAQNFVHPQLDEYVDEVIFAEPVVITACEFLEQNGPSASAAVTLLGATSPPSFALEVFVQCEGDTRFRRLCQPFLYSHSSSNVLEVEAVVTNHLVVRGSYRSLSLVIYGNTAEDLGQFSLEFDLDSSLTNLVSSTETKLDDLLPLLHERNQKVEDSTLSLKALPSLLPASDVSTEIRQFLQLVLKILDISELGDFIHTVVSTVCSVAASFFKEDSLTTGIDVKKFKRVSNSKDPLFIFVEAGKTLLDHCKELNDAGRVCAESLLDSSFLEPDAELATSKQLVDVLFHHFQFKGDYPFVRHPHLSQCAVLSVLRELSGENKGTHLAFDVFTNLRSQLKKIMKLANSFRLVEDPSPVASATRLLLIGQTEGLLSYKATSKLIASSSCCFLNRDIDSNLLSLLKERGFLPLSIALLSSSKLRAGVGHYIDVFVDVILSIQATTLLLLFSRSGLVFLLHNPELSSLMTCALNEAGSLNKDECIPHRYGYTLISKGFLCPPQEVATNVEMQMRVVKGIARLITLNLHAEELLWVLWELCALSRTPCGRQALLTIGHFPEAILVLIEALRSAKESELVALSSGTPLNLAIFHSAAEIFETLVMDPTSSSIGSWIDYATELHKALHSSSPGSNRKDAPTRLLEWIDAGVVYHKNGALGLLHYTAVLASGGDAHITSTNILVSDSMDIENAEGDSSNGPDANVVENLLGKLVSDKSFEGVALRDSALTQLTTALRILAFISENADVASVIYDEGGLKVVYVVLLNCKLMLERSFNNYDYLVDEGTETNSTSDLLLERNREKCLIDTIIPTLLLLKELLKKLKDAKEQHRNTKLMIALLQLHRELSPKLATCAADLSSTYPEYAFSLETVCHLIASALAYWPTLAWAPGLFHTLLDNNDLFPEEGVWLWKDGMPLLTALRLVAVGSILGPYKERELNWYLEPVHTEQLTAQLAPNIQKIAQVLLRYAASALSVMQDVLRVFIIRVACQRTKLGGMLVRPIISWILDHMHEPLSPQDTDTYKVYKLLDFVSCLLEHPLAKTLVLMEGVVPMLVKVLQRCSYAGGAPFPDVKSSTKSGFTLFSCCLPALKSISLICDSETTAKYSGSYDGQCKFTVEDSTLIFHQLFKLFQVFPVEKELAACLCAFKNLTFCAEGHRSLLEISLHIKSNSIDNDQLVREQESHGSCSFGNADWSKHPLLVCWTGLYKSVEKDGLSKYAVEALHALCLGALKFCILGKRFNEDRVDALKYLFGLYYDTNGANSEQQEHKKYIHKTYRLLQSKFTGDEDLPHSVSKTTLQQVLESCRLLSMLMQEQTDIDQMDDNYTKAVNLLAVNQSRSPRKRIFRDSCSRKAQNDLHFGEFGEEFQWECPENLRNRLSQAGAPGKRKVSSSDALNRHGRGDNPPNEAPSMFSRGSGMSAASSGPTRRDSFRQRKPNTSRPPSMHVDDYVARERNDGTVNSNVIAVPRIGSSSGRPPSIHVDEFIARQRERQVAMAGSETVSQGKVVPSPNETKAEKSNKPKQIKVDIDDDLHGIDIVFDVEESEPDDKLPFPQTDDIVQRAASSTGERSPPRSIVEESQSDMNDLGTTVALNLDDNAQSELSSRMSVSRPEISLTREPSISSKKKYNEQPDEKKISLGVSSMGSAVNVDGATVTQGQASADDIRMPSRAFYPHNNMLQTGNLHAVNAQAQHEPKFLPNQPPLPPTPPPPTISPIRSLAPDTVRAPSPFMNSMTDVHPTTYHVQAEHQPGYSNMPTTYPRVAHSSPVGPARSLPPLPSTPPPFPAKQFTVSLRNSTAFGNQSGKGPTEILQSSGALNDDAQLSTILQSGSRHTYLSIPNASFSRPSAMHGNIPSQQPFDSLPSISPSNLASQSSMQSVHPLSQLQPLQPPQLNFPPQLPQYPRPTGQALQQSQVQQQYQIYYQHQRQENYSQLPPHQQQAEHSQLQTNHQQRDAVPEVQRDSAMTLQHYFSSPEAIQSLLSDRDKLCQLLEQHPKLMQMLQVWCSCS
ncbi:hypothetical protein V2J09_004355, partial [Rumex salicifolius]